MFSEGNQVAFILHHIFGVNWTIRRDKYTIPNTTLKHSSNTLWITFAKFTHPPQLRMILNNRKLKETVYLQLLFKINWPLTSTKAFGRVFAVKRKRDDLNDSGHTLEMQMLTKSRGLHNFFVPQKNWKMYWAKCSLSCRNNKRMRHMFS